MAGSGNLIIYDFLKKGGVPAIDDGSGRSLPPELLLLCTIATVLTTWFSTYSLVLQLKHYYKPRLQRYVVRILVMPMLYAVSSTISLFSLQLAEMIDLMRDLYEAFVIYCFFNLLVEYLSGEAAILAHTQEKEPIPHIIPFNYCFKPMDLGNPYTFLTLKRGILQYVQIKPVLAVATVFLKIYGKYEDGHLHLRNGYTWISIIYNFSVFVALYALTMFWLCLRKELSPYRVASKFFCVKGVIFFSFWQDLTISILVSTGLIQHIGRVVDDTYLSAAMQDTLICIEMPIFAFLHIYAFSYEDYIERPRKLAGRMPLLYALRDSFGLADILADSIATVYGTEYNYESDDRKVQVEDQSSISSDLLIHSTGQIFTGKGKGRSNDGEEDQPTERTSLIKKTRELNKRYQAINVAHDDDKTLQFPDLTEEEQHLYDMSRRLPYGDYRYPCIYEP